MTSFAEANMKIFIFVAILISSVWCSEVNVEEVTVYS